MRDEPFEWQSPATYPTRPGPARVEAIANDILNGATLNAAAMKHGVMPERLKAWLRWGAEAYARDADENDSHAMYLNLFLKLGQALGTVAVEIQQRILRESPQWWLTHHPELRGEWGGDNALALLTFDNGAVEADAGADAQIEAPRATGDDLRRALRVLIDAGAAVDPPTELEDALAIPDVDADAPTDADDADDADGDADEDEGTGTG